MSLENLYNEGIKYLQSGEYVKAIESFSYLINRSPEHDYLIYLLGLSYYLNKDFDNAILAFDKALKIKPNNDDYLFNLAHCYINKKDFEKAINILRKCIEISPANLEYYKDLGIILQEAKQYNEALKIYEFLLREVHDDDIYNNYGLIHLEKNAYILSRDYFKKAIEINPSKSKYYANIALSFIQEYEYFYKKSKINSYDEYTKLSEYYNNLLKEALKFTLRAIELNSKDPDYHNYYGMILLRYENYLDAIKEFNIAIKLNDSNAYYYSNLASAYEEINNHEKARDFYLKALNLDSKNEHILKNYAFLLLKISNSNLGIEEYLKINSELKISILDYFKKEELTNNIDFKNKVVYISGEQGLGDEIQFIRYLKLLKDKGTYVILKCRPSLLELFKNYPYYDEIVTSEKDLKEFDYFSLIISLPLLLEKSFKTNIDTPYLITSENKKEYWFEKLQKYKKKKIAFTWKSKFPNITHFKRSTDFHYFYNLAKEFPEIDFISIQKGYFEKEFHNNENLENIFNLSDEINDFTDTAGILENIDMLISIDSSVVHLAGALNKKVVTLIPFRANWRWGLESSSTFWYPSMTLIRQDKINDWQSVFNQLYNLLKSLQIEE